MRPYELLLLDFGGVCLLTPFELHHRFEAANGLAPGTLDWHGPFNPADDQLWQELLLGEQLQERRYWELRAAALGRLVGRPLTTRDYMQVLYEPPGADLTRPEAVSTVQTALQAGIRVAVLTNDLRAFHGPDWAAGIPLLGMVERIIDCSESGILKPDPRAYQRAVDELGVPADRMLFVDDQVLNVQGAQVAGLHTAHLDVTDAASSWADVMRRLGC